MLLRSTTSSKVSSASKRQQFRFQCFMRSSTHNRVGSRCKASLVAQLSAQGADVATPAKVLIIGGCGRVGSAAAIHLLSEAGWCKPMHVTIAGRRDADQMAPVQREILQGAGGEGALQQRGQRLQCASLDYTDAAALQAAIQGVDVVMHTAGPYLGKKPDILEACIESGVPVYVDLSDPLDFLEEAQSMSSRAVHAGTSAVVAAGAFPGLSNVLAVHLAKQLSEPVSDIKFSYFTSGLGGSGVLNLLITNLGFGEPVWTLRRGQRSPQVIGGTEPETIEFFIDEGDASKQRIGSSTVWAWPFPEVCTVGETLQVCGSTDVKMGTAPELWNVILVAMAKVIPRSWWRNEAFSQFLADFSEPLVWLADRFVGETHGMRVEVSDVQGNTATAVQAHDSFRVCVGQSCAEFAMHLLQQKMEGQPQVGVQLPEQLALKDDQRQLLLQRLLSTPGTFTTRLKLSSTANSLVESRELLPVR